jgi:hypothetical protein
MAIQKRVSRLGKGVCGGVFAFSPNLAEPRGRESVHQNGPAEPARYSRPKAMPAGMLLVALVVLPPAVW